MQPTTTLRLIGFLPGVLAAVLLAGCAAPPVPNTAAGFAQAVRVVDDPMEAGLSLQSPKMPIAKPHPDVYVNTVQLLARLNRQTGAATIVVSHSIEHRLGTWLFFTGATYMDASGSPQTAAVFSRDRGNVENCDRYGCRYIEGSGFVIPEGVLASLVKDANVKQRPDGWRLRFRSQRVSVDGVVEYPRLAGFLRAIQRERAKIGASASQAR